MRRILAGSSVLGLFLLVAPARAASSVPTAALLALVPDRATIATATGQDPTASVYTLTATATGSGSISPSGEVKVAAFSDQTVTMTPVPCALVSNRRVDGSDLGPPSTHTIQTADSDPANR